MKKSNKIILTLLVAALSSAGTGNIVFANELDQKGVDTHIAKTEKNVHVPFIATQKKGTFADDEPSADKYGQPELTHQVKDIMVPNIVDSIVKAFPAFSYLDQSSIGYGLSFIKDPTAFFSARILGGILISSRPGQAKPIGFKRTNGLQINLDKYSTGWNPTSGFNDREAFERILVHEMIHAFTIETLPRGFNGFNKDGIKDDSQSFPVWFSEGVADAVAGEMDFSLKLGALDKDAPDYVIEQILKTLETGSVKSVHGAGYYASLYLGQIMSGKDEFSGTNIRKGLNTLFESLISGTSFDDTLKNHTKYMSLDNFEKNVTKDKNAYDFIRWVLKERNYNRQNAKSTGFGGILTGDLSARDVVSDTVPKFINPLFKLDSSTSTINNEYPKEVTVLSGASKTDSGNKPVVTYQSVSLPTPVKLDAPKVTYSVKDSGETTASWNEAANALSYKIELYKNDVLVDERNLENKTTYTFKTNLIDSKEYVLKIKAIGNNGKYIESDATVVKGYPPVLKGIEDITIKLNDKFNSLNGVIATDNEDGIISNTEVSGSVNTSKIGTYILTYKVTDSDGNITTAVRKVTVRTNTKPVINAPFEVVHIIGEPIDTKKGITATDKEDGDITDRLTQSGYVNYNKFGKYQVSYSVTDRDGNKAVKYLLLSVVKEDKFDYLSDINWKSAEQSWGTTMKDVSVDKNTLRLTKKDGSVQTYKKGIGTHADASIVYDLTGKNYKYFTSYVGVDREKFNTKGSVTFEVYVDGKKAYDSGLMRSKDAQKFIKVDIDGARELKLVVTDGKNGIGQDHATWGNAKLVSKEKDVVVKDTLQALVDKFIKNLEDGIDFTSIRNEDWSAYVAAYDKADLALTNINISQSEINQITEEFIQAEKNLKR